MSIAEKLLVDGYGSIESVHGETVTVLGGVDAGKVFTAVQDLVEDFTLDELTGPDRRAKRVLRFRAGATAPTLASQDHIRTSNGRVWKAVKCPGNTFLTVDYELREVVAGKDS